MIIKFDENSQNFIEICYLNDKYIFMPEIILDFYNQNALGININLLINNSYKEYINDFLLFYNDSTSPIFDEKKIIIGNAFKDVSKIKDYSKFLINTKLVSVVKFYLNCIKLRINSNKLKKGKYYLINAKYFDKYKQYYDYYNLETILNQNKSIPNSFLYIIINSLNNNEFDEQIINDKKATIVIKTLLNDYNLKYNEKFNSNNQLTINNIVEEPNVEFVENLLIYYYNEFELISEFLYNSLFEKNNQSSNTIQNVNYFTKCKLLNNYIFFEIPKSFNSKSNEYIIEVAILNGKNIYNACYLLVYGSSESFLKDFEPIFNDPFRFEKFLNKYQLIKSNESQQINDINGKPTGMIFNLLIINKNKNSFLNQNTLLYNNILFSGYKTGKRKFK